MESAASNAILLALRNPVLQAAPGSPGNASGAFAPQHWTHRSSTVGPGFGPGTSGDSLVASLGSLGEPATIGQDA